MELSIMPYTILYIEDETAIIELAHDILEHPDVRLVSTNQVEEGLDRLRELKPDLLLLDVLMPERSGWSVYHEVRGTHEFRSLPIIMLTGQLHRYRVMRDFANSQIDAYITKPFDVLTVRGEIEKMLGVPIWSKKQPEAGSAAAPEKKPEADSTAAPEKKLEASSAVAPEKKPEAKSPAKTSEREVPRPEKPGPEPEKTGKPQPTASNDVSKKLQSR
jgi:CheY-like chemotaxis protein